jgi:AbrB family looped-hinge helix DNA binding protein
MKTTIDRAGRVVIPKELRERAGLKPGAEVEVRCNEGIVEIVPPAPQGRLVREGSLLVWEPAPGTPVLTSDDVNKAIEDMWQEREREILEGGH